MSDKSKRLKEKLDNHLRQTARQLVKFDTFEETLNYLLESFWREFACDFVAIILKDKEKLVPRVWRGATVEIERVLTLAVDECSPNLLLDALWWPNENVTGGNECLFRKAIEKEELSTWFTVPLKEETKGFGFCIIGFRNFVPLIIELEKIFVEFGKDVASAMNLAQQKEIQKRKIKGIEWLRENIFPGSSIEELVEKIVERAGKGTNAQEAYIYLYDENKNCFTYQPPSFGVNTPEAQISIDNDTNLTKYFPYLDVSGGNEITIPLVINLKTIGVLHVRHKVEGFFTLEDVELLQFLASHVSALIENARLYNREIDDRRRMQTFMQHHQELIKQTVEGEDFDEISGTLSHIFYKSIFLFDRFLRPITHSLWNEEEDVLDKVCSVIAERKQELRGTIFKEKWISINKLETNGSIGIWPVIGGGDLLGYLVIHMHMNHLDKVLRFTLNHALHVYAIQFIKQKLVVDVNEQVKDSFINQLLIEKIEDREKIIQYCNLINWNLFNPHRLSVLTVHNLQLDEDELNLLDLEARKSGVWDQIRETFSVGDKEIIMTRKDGEFVFITPKIKEQDGIKKYWQKFYERMKTIVHKQYPTAQLYLGIGGLTERLEDYCICYKQAMQTHNVVFNHFQKKGYAIFDELGSYTVLYSLKEADTALLFMNKYVRPLVEYSNRKGTELFQTLRVYLSNNGNLKDTAESLFIHRSSLKYRLERIKAILDVDIDDAEVRFNLMMAYKLYDLYADHFLHG